MAKQVETVERQHECTEAHTLTGSTTYITQHLEPFIIVCVNISPTEATLFNVDLQCHLPWKLCISGHKVIWTFMLNFQSGFTSWSLSVDLKFTLYKRESEKQITGGNCHQFKIFRQKWKGGQSGTYQRLTISVVGSTGEHRKDVEMKRKNIE